MEQPEIESAPLPAVKNLRSKFEQLALETAPGPSKRPTGIGLGLSPKPTSPRPRATSGGSGSPVQAETRHLRTASSSSDLTGIKRPPPPPPSRGSRAPSGSVAPSPTASPLLRPVPSPSNASSSVAQPSPRLGSSSLPTLPPPFITNVTRPSPHLVSVQLPANDDAAPSEETNEFTPSNSVSSLRNMFANTALISPVPGRGHVSRSSLSSINSDLFSSSLPSRPIVPPRPSTSSKESSSSSIQFITSSPEEMHGDRNNYSSSSSISHSPFSDDEDPESSSTSVPAPALPVRKPQSGHESGFSHVSTSTYSNSSSRTSSESDVSQHSTPASKSSRSTNVPPPRPPPRHRGTTPATPATPTESAPSLLLSPPPPLPVRRSTVAILDDLPPPRLPNRPPLATPLAIPSHAQHTHTLSDSAPSASAISAPSPTISERKAFGSSKLPPPPTRTIALGGKLPPARRPPTPSSDEESGDEEDNKGHAVDLLPDSSQSSRRPPTLSHRGGYSEAKIHVPAHTGIAIVAGTSIVVAHGHHVRVYDLSVSEHPVWNLDAKDIGISKDFKVTSMEWRGSGKAADRACFVWIGTKEGHLFEVDLRTGTVSGSKPSAHLHAVIHIFRYGRSMLSIDDTGKVLVFAAEGNEDVSLTYTPPRVVRITEKLDFARIIGRMLWTAARADCQGAGTPSRTPVIRVYDIFNPASIGRSVIPSEHVGPVTSAALIPSLPGHAYVGHEEGYISIWSLQTDDGYPKCVEVMKVSVSDVLSLAGVNGRLWAGSRNGIITAYDVAPRPWVVTNCWNAHPGLPVQKLSVDYFGVEKKGRLCVLSVGRDEHLRLWDGLLSDDWIDKELWKQEPSFSKFRDLRLLIVSWNADSARPDTLSGDAANINFLHDVLHSVDSPDIISFGLQEVIDLESRKMAAKNVLLGNKKNGGEGGLSGLSDKVTGAYKRWYDALLLAVRMAMPPQCPYSVIHTESLVGLFTCIFVKNTERGSLKDLAITTIKRGMGGRYGNKGGTVARFVVEDTSICFINCHLAAGQNAVRARNADVTGMLEASAVFPVTSEPLAYVGGGDGSMVLDHEIVFVNGDMNYRIDQRREPIISAVRSNEFESLFIHDQLLKEIKYNRACRFRGFSEGPLAFAPTYKYDRRSNEYDSSEKRRSPAWCDRILWRSRVAPRVQQLHYKRYEANVSDHRPISAAFKITVKSVKHDVQQRVKADVQMKWVEEEERLLSALKEFFAKQALI